MPYIKLAAEHSVQVRHTPFTIGSDPTCDLSLQGRSVLPRHLILQSRGSVWQAATLSSRAIAYINDRPLDSLALLKDGDIIKVGNVTMIWREQSAPISRQSPWKGLLIIFLAVVAMLSLVFGWYGFSNNREMTSSPDSVPTEPLIRHLTPVGGGENGEGHPAYHIELPSP